MLFFSLLYPLIADPTLNRSDLIIQPRFDEVISNSIDFMKRRQKPDGSWVYDHLPFDGKTTFKGSLVRMAGTFYSLAVTYQGNDKELKDMIDKAIGFFTLNTREFVRRGKTLRIISESHEGYTGTICLFLSGWLLLHHKFPEEFPVDKPHYMQFMDTLEYYSDKTAGITRYINTKEDYVEKLGRDAEVYASAQHFLTLSIFHLTFKRKYFHPKLKEYIALYDRKWKYEILPQSYHWVMQAYYYLYLIENPDLQRVLPRMIENLQSAFQQHYTLENKMSNTCSIAEGYSSYYRYKMEEKELSRAMMYSLSNNLRHLKNFQILPGMKKRIRATEEGREDQYVPMKDPHLAEGGFWARLEGKHSTRIDMTQHCLTAYVHHRYILDNLHENLRHLVNHREHTELLDWLQAQRQRGPELKKMHSVLLKEVWLD